MESSLMCSVATHRCLKTCAFLSGPINKNPLTTNQVNVDRVLKRGLSLCFYPKQEGGDRRKDL